MLHVLSSDADTPVQKPGLRQIASQVIKDNRNCIVAARGLAAVVCSTRHSGLDIHAAGVLLLSWLRNLSLSNVMDIENWKSRARPYTSLWSGRILFSP